MGAAGKHTLGEPLLRTAALLLLLAVNTASKLCVTDTECATINYVRLAPIWRPHCAGTAGDK